ncbi:MAG: hypothetical protein DK306_001221 [Chloroflexi bacterium]|nr:MAG: hypothetical protein DK306_001221 [Chloroflexota bacterium]
MTSQRIGRARQLTISASDDVDEFLFDQGLTDGLPVVPPTPARVERMLAQTRRDPLEEIGILPPNLAPLTVEKTAINAVMAGCKAEYFPTVLAGVEAIADDSYGLHGSGATTMGGAPVLIVNGPVRERIGINSAQNALGQGNRANATIGRAVRLVIRNVAGHRPGGTERATIGWPGKFTLCFGEWEERAPTWTPMHVERGFAAGDSVITAMTQSGGPTQLIDETSRTAKALAGSIGLKVAGQQHPRIPSMGELIVVISPEHYDTLAADGWTKDDVRRRIQQVAARPLRDLLESDQMGGFPKSALDSWPPFLPPLPIHNPDGSLRDDAMDVIMPKFGNDSMITIVVAGGGAGKFTSILDPLAGQVSVSKKIEDPV